MESRFALANRAQLTRRRRKITICQSCSSRRVKCDRQKPKCSKCASSGIDCIYTEDNGNIKTDPEFLKRTQVPTSGITSAEIGLLAVDSRRGQSRYAHAAHWASLLREDNVEDLLVEADNSSGQIVVQLQRLATRYLPSRSICDELISIYLKNSNSFLPLLLPGTTEKFDRLFVRLSNFEYEIDDNDNFICIFFAVLHAGSIILNEAERYHPNEKRLRKGDTRKEDITKYLSATEEALRLFQFPSKPTMPCLVAASIVEAFRAPVAGVLGAGSVSFLIRIAQSMGLHRDPGLFKIAHLTTEEEESRRALWWYLLYLDISSSVASGLPPSIAPYAHDIKLPSGSVGTQSGGLTAIYANGVYIGCRTMAVIVNDVYGTQEVTEEKLISIKKIVTDSEESIRSCIKRISQFDVLADHNIESLLFIRNLRKFQSQVLAMLCEKSRLILYHAISFEKRKQVSKAISNDPFFSTSEFVRSAVNLLKHYTSMFSETDFSKFLWRMRNYHQLHSIIIVLRDIFDFPDKPSYQSETEAADGDERIGLVLKALEISKFMRVDEESVKQWSNLIRFKDAAWKVKFPNSMTQNSEISGGPMQSGWPLVPSRSLSIGDWTSEVREDSLSLEPFWGFSDYIDLSSFSFGM